mmetsp:Transcript_69463/g.175107  ORF Transcript_69463/g.175107 Transcript_69463/m.175107 type:complete len:212 (+) Transcript_69463:1-636(+)
MDWSIDLGRAPSVDLSGVPFLAFMVNFLTSGLPDSTVGGELTIVLQALPKAYTRDMVEDMLVNNGFLGHFNFLYLPCDFVTGSSFGYAFVNMVTAQKATECFLRFNGFNSWVVHSDRVCEVVLATTQGVCENIERYRNSPVMHHHVPESLKPVILNDNGLHLVFPPPTKKVKAPKKLYKQPVGNAEYELKVLTTTPSVGHPGLVTKQVFRF